MFGWIFQPLCYLLIDCGIHYTQVGIGCAMLLNYHLLDTTHVMVLLLLWGSLVYVCSMCIVRHLSGAQ